MRHLAVLAALLVAGSAAAAPPALVGQQHVRLPSATVTSPVNGTVRTAGPVVISGTATPGMVVVVLVNNTVAGVVTASAQGAWSLPYEAKVGAMSVTTLTGLSSSTVTVTGNVPAAVLSAASHSGVTSSSATLAFTSNQSCTTAGFDYGTTTSYGSYLQAQPGTSISATHSALAASTTYHYRGRCVANGITVYTTPNSFTTSAPPQTPQEPVVSNLEMTITSNGAVVSWDVTPASTGQIRHGPTSAFGNATEKENAFLTHHLQTIDGYIAGSTVWFTIDSTTADAQSKSTLASSFQTSSAPPVVAGTIESCTAMNSPPHSSTTPVAMQYPAGRGANNPPAYSSGDPASTAVIDPVYGTTLIRISGDPGVAVANPNNEASLVDVKWNTGVGSFTRPGPDYSKHSAWDAGHTLLWLQKGTEKGGTRGTLILDGNTYKPLYFRNIGAASRWHPARADHAIYVESDGRVGVMNVRTAAKTVIYTPSGFSMSSSDIGFSDGNPSNDGRYILVNGNSGGVAGFIIVDLGTAWPPVAGQGSLKKAFTSLSSLGASGAGSASVTPSGAYWWVSNGTKRVYRMSDNVQVGTISDGSHSDMGVSVDGADVFAGYSNTMVMQSMGGVSTTLLTNTGNNQHMSGRGPSGWMLAQYETDTGSTSWPAGDLIFVELKASPRVRRIAQHFTTGGSTYRYWASPFAVPTRDGLRAVFRSNWGATGTDAEQLAAVNAYVVDARPLCGG